MVGVLSPAQVLEIIEEISKWRLLSLASGDFCSQLGGVMVAKCAESLASSVGTRCALSSGMPNSEIKYTVYLDAPKWGNCKVKGLLAEFATCTEFCRSSCECGTCEETLYLQDYPGELSTPEDLDGVRRALETIAYCSDHHSLEDGLVATPWGTLRILDNEVFPV
jgi:hypothetical protein